MKTKHIGYRILTTVLSCALFAQGGFVVPASANDIFGYELYYHENTNISSEHPIVIPDAPDTGEPELHHYSGDGTFDSVISNWGEDPYRIIGYTFDGWFTEQNGEGTKVDKNTVITEDLVGITGMLYLHGNWKKYNSPYINSGSVSYSYRNANEERITPEVIWTTDAAGTQISDFDKDTEDYYTYVYANTAYIKLDFEQYEPDANTTVTINDSSVETSEEDITTDKGYCYMTDDEGTGVLTAQDSVVTGKKISTAYMPLNLASDEQEYNEIKITVTLPEGDDGIQATKTYTFHIKRYSKEMRAEYGNTPYGRIMSSTSYTDDQKATLKSKFDASYIYRSGTFSTNAWNIYGDNGEEVKKGTETEVNQYINYDKDETAIVVYSGDSFTDPGVTIYDNDGTEISPSSTYPIERTVIYETVDSLKFSDWGTAAEKTETTNLTGSENENIINILKNDYVKPGIYKISYKYDFGDGTVPLTAERNMIVLPKVGDMNMDNYINALDVFMYDMDIEDDNISNTLYKYRALDISSDGRGDGTVDENDITYFLTKNRSSIVELYPSLSVSEEITQTAYTVPTEADTSKTQMYMEFMGTDADNAPTSAADSSTVLNQGDTVWIGYRFANTANIGSTVNSITLSIDYDSRYINPKAITTSTLIEHIQKYNPDLSVFDITGSTSYNAEYETDSSTASHTWTSPSSVNTLIIEMHLNSGSSFTLSDGYFIKLPFTVSTVPTNDGRSVISTKLGASYLNINADNAEYGYMWDTSDSLNSVTTNLMNKLQYMGDYVPVFGAEADATVLDNAEYGTQKSYSGFVLKGELEGSLPDGMTYTPNTGVVSGTPTKAGMFVFYIGGTKYQITVNKAKMTVTADDKTKVYGSANPELTFQYDESCLRNDDAISDAVQTAPTLYCDADTTTDCQDAYPINFTADSGESANYYFEYVSGKLSITQKEITVSSVSVPKCSINASFPCTISSSCGSDAFTASGIINNDEIILSYNVTYTDTNSTKAVGEGKSVTVSGIKTTDLKNYPKGNNYTVTTESFKLSTGVIEDSKITGFSLVEECTLKYTYGEPLDLDTGTVKLTYDSGISTNMTFKGAQESGIKITYNNSDGDEVVDDTHLTVADTGKSLYLSYNGSAQWTDSIKVGKKDLTVTADDKTRVYGDNNPDLTYTFTASDFAYSETTATLEAELTFVKPTLTCAATADTEIDKENGETEVPIVISGGSADNYNIVCNNGTLTINKRPLTVSKITSGVPTLTSNYYLDTDGTQKTAPYNVPASAEYTAENKMMELSNLYSSDEVKVTYNAQYANCTPVTSTSVTVADLAMDDTFGKSYNYTVSDTSTTTADGGKIYPKNIMAIEITEQPTLTYTYGTPLDLKTGKIKLTYDNGQDVYVNFKEAQELTGHCIDLSYTRTDGETAKTDAVSNEAHLTVADSGNRITVTPKTKDTDSDNVYTSVSPVTTDEITINPYVLKVKANDVYTTYGTDIDEYTNGYKYTYENVFQYDDTEDTAVNPKPQIICKEDDGTTDANQKTPAGEYTLSIGGGKADNYDFEYTEGTLVIRQRPLVVETVHNIPSLTSKEAYIGETKKSIDVKTDQIDEYKTNNEPYMTFTDGCAPLWDDYVRITCTAEYTDASAVGETTAAIKDAAIDRTYGSARNYYLQSVKSPQTGNITAALMTKIEITTDPTQTDEGESKEYSYGDDLDFSSGRYKLTYDSGLVIKDVTLEDLSKYGVTAKYTDTEKTTDDVISGAFASIDKHNGNSITLTPPDGAEAVTTGKITVNKRSLHVLVNDASYTYGNSAPEYTFTYDTSDFAPGETTPVLALGTQFTAPTIKCSIDGAAADNKTSAGTYEGAITVSGGKAHNYEFICDDTGDLTVNKRDLNITSIKSGIPDLTSALAYKYNYELPIKLGGTAENSDMELDNVNSDIIEITYNAVYNSLEQSDDAEVGIEDVAFSSDCAAANNYVIKSYPTTASGKIMTRLMSEIKINSSPTKMEYTYGEWFALSGGSVDIVYNNGYTAEGVTFDKLKDYGISLTFVKHGETDTEIGEVKNNTLLTVPEYNGTVIKLEIIDSSEADSGLTAQYSDPLIVNKHKIKVIAGDKTVTYGDDAPEYTFSYNTGDLVNGDSLSSARFTDGLSEPTVSCADYTDKTSPSGNYTITAQGGGSSNYEFEYVSGTLTVNKKPISITEITGGVPSLTSDIMYKYNYVMPITVAASAAYTKSVKDFTAEGIINDDEIGITYDAVYTSTASEQTVDAKNIGLDDTYEKSACYELTSVPNTASGGKIYSEEISKVTIEDDPVLRDDNNEPIAYTYGDKIDLNRGSVTVEYDSGKILRGIRFSELTNVTGGKITLVYTDGETETAAADGDIVTALYHNGKSIKLKVTTSLDTDEPQTEKLSVAKAIVTVTAADKERYYGDENPALEYVYSGFVNGDDENSDNFKSELSEPEITCDASEKSAVGEYEIKLLGGSSANYSFELFGATLTVTKRPLDVVSITNGVPALTSDIIYKDSQLVHKLSGTAINTAGQTVLNNLSYGDTVKLTYTAVYTSIEPSDNVTVDISDIAIDESYMDGGNYVLRSVPDKSDGGRIYAAQISAIEIMKQPKLEYTYGETLDLSETGVRITYDSGLIIKDIAYDDLSSYGIDVIMTNANGDSVNAKSGDKLTVTEHNGSYLTLTPTNEINGVIPAVSKTITVNKKTMDVNIKDISSQYGDDPTGKFSFSYNESDFAYDETYDSDEFRKNLVKPTFVCKERDGLTDVGASTDAGSYTVTMTGGQSDNYKFVYNNGTLVIQKRNLIIKDITGNIPELTSDVIFQNPGSEHELDASADNSNLELENLIGGDKVRILYKAVYKTEEPSDNCDVEIKYVSMDDTYGNSVNYRIDENSSIKSVDGGKVNNREITSVEIINQPKTEYTYGDRLDISGGTVNITYDSGYVDENVPFIELENYNISISYTDDGDFAAAASDGDKLSVSEHDGKYIKLSAKSTHKTEDVKTDRLTVHKLVLEYGQCTAESIVYDGKSTQTTGKIVFSNAVNGDNVEASGTFAFEDCAAGENKTVNITEIKLLSPFDENYELAQDNTVTKGTISKAELSVSLTEDGISISDETNTITITAPEMTQLEKDGGAKYEYSVDGGKTWQDSNVFENLDLNLDCGVCIRFAKTDNFAESEASEPIEMKTFKNKLTLISKDDMTTLKSFYTNTTSIEKETDFKTLIGDVGVTYYNCYTDESGNNLVKYPMELDGDVKIYTTLKKKTSHRSGGGSSSGSTATPTPTPAPTSTTEPEPTPTSAPTLSPTPAVDTVNEIPPYLSGYEGKINPDGYMTRAEAATIMVVLSGGLQGENQNIFSDVADGTWYKKYIAQAENEGYITGFEDGTFKPEEAVTREQLVSMILHYTGLSPETGDMPFDDIFEGRWSYGYILAAYNAGIVTGYSDNNMFKPENEVTRAEAARIINTATNREVDTAYIDSILCPYSDLDRKHWAYYELMSASIYIRQND